jgi:hypothetical protein
MKQPLPNRTRAAVSVRMAGLVLVATLAVPGWGQAYRTSVPTMNRPSELGPSQQIGGASTRGGGGGGGGLSIGNMHIRGGRESMTGMASLYGVKSFGSGQQTGGLLPVGAQFGQVGQGTLGGYGESSLMRSSRRDLLSYNYGLPVTGLTGSLGDIYLGNVLDRPVAPTYVSSGIEDLPSLAQPIYSPKYLQDPFQAIMGMAPTPPSEPETPLPPISAMLMEQNLQRGMSAESEALLYFKRGTQRSASDRNYWQCPTCPDDLSAAVRSLGLVRILKSRDPLPSLLLAHVALEQGRVQFGTTNILNAVLRNPDLFKADPDALNMYFGDVTEEGGSSRVLDAQMRQYLREADQQPNSAMAHALSSYCAWRLKDITRAVQLAQRADELARMYETNSSAEVAIFAAAVRAAVRR